MKALLFVSCLFVSGVTLADQTVRLQPGSSITIEPQETTTVFCEGGGGGGGGGSGYCKCLWGPIMDGGPVPKNSWGLFRVTVTPFGIYRDLVQNFGYNGEACQSAITTHPACR